MTRLVEKSLEMGCCPSSRVLALNSIELV
uniref:Uncharacterized protein n=1 Tax=Arundo donax TaxID=35708 RepID=A0A0A9C0L4_ARUDO